MTTSPCGSAFFSFKSIRRCFIVSPDYMATWKKASEDFQKSFKDYLRLMGVVPKEEHLTLVKKYEELKEKFAFQEDTIKNLRMLLDEKKAEPQGEVAKGFQEIMEKQTEQFQETMETFGRFFKKISKLFCKCLSSCRFSRYGILALKLCSKAM